MTMGCLVHRRSICQSLLTLQAKSYQQAIHRKKSGGMLIASE